MIAAYATTQHRGPFPGPSSSSSSSSASHSSRHDRFYPKNESSVVWIGQSGTSSSSSSSSRMNSDQGMERNRRRAGDQSELRVWKSVSDKEGRKGMTVVNFGMGVKKDEIKRKERSVDGSMGLGLGMGRGRGMRAGSAGMGSVTVVPVLSPPESSISHPQQTTTNSASSSTSSSASSSNASSTCTTPMDLREQGQGGSSPSAMTIEDDLGRPKGSFWANYPARPGLPRSSSPMTTDHTIISATTSSTVSTTIGARRSSSASAASSCSSSFDRQGRRLRAGLAPVCPGLGGRYSRGRSGVIKGNAGGYYYTPFPSPYTLDGVDSDADEEEDEPDEMIRAKDHKWFLAPLVECERAVGGSTIVRRSSGSVSVSAEGQAGARAASVQSHARKLSRRSVGRRPRFKLFHMEDDMEDKTTHQEKNQGLLSVLLGGDGGAVAEACGEDERVTRGTRRRVQDSRICGLSREEWPLSPVDTSLRLEDSNPTPRSPLSRHIDITSTCWRGRDYARYQCDLQCRASPSFYDFKQMTEDHVDVHESPMDSFLFSVQLSFISTSDDQDDQDPTQCSLPPPRRRSDGDLLRKRVLEWNMVLNGKVSNVRAREDKAPRDPKRRSSCPAKLSAMRAIEEEEGDGDYEGDHKFEQESPSEMDGECDWFDGRQFQNR